LTALAVYGQGAGSSRLSTSPSSEDGVDEWCDSRTLRKNHQGREEDHDDDNWQQPELLSGFKKEPEFFYEL
jgi:hypothetical protein